ncbi:MAG: HEAT repeat domain-containing protein [Methanobacteriaceae archaeon]|nr:HEAT repeat domain-containing protein [Methanobacteriaceae archaeon]
MNSAEPDIDLLIDNRDVEGLITALNHENYLIRKQGAFGLKKVGDERAVEPLINALRYKNWHNDYTLLTSVRENAAEALGFIGSEDAIEPLIKTMDTDPDEEVRWKAAWALGEIGSPHATEVLIRALKDNSWTVRRHAANSLGIIGDQDAVPPLMKALEDKDWHVRKYAAVALGKMKDEVAIPFLLEALEDEDADVRWKAGSSLVSMGGLAVPSLIKKFKKGNWHTRGRAAEILGRIGDERALQPLMDSLTPGKFRDKHRHVRGKAAEALGRIGDIESLEILQRVYNEDEYKYVREKAEEAINKIRKLSVSTKILNYDNGEVTFDYPDDWELLDTADSKKIVKGYYANSSISLSLNRQADVEEISSAEFAEMLRNVIAIQNSSLISEDMFKRDEMEVYQMVAENNEVVPTDILTVSFKKKDLLYYLWFAGDPTVLKEAEEGIQLILDSFYIY